MGEGQIFKTFISYFLNKCQHLINIRFSFVVMSRDLCVDNAKKIISTRKMIFLFTLCKSCIYFYNIKPDQYFLRLSIDSLDTAIAGVK